MKFDAKAPMRIAVLTSPESWYLADLKRAAGERHEIFPVAWREISSALGGVPGIMAGGVDLAQVDAVLVRTMPAGSLEQVIFRMDALAQLAGRAALVVNPPRAVEVAIDKYLATARMAAAGLRVPRTFACQTANEALAAFESLGRDVVVKPLFGSEGRGLTRIADEALAERAFQLLVGLGAVVYLQEFIPHEGFDIRVLVIGRRRLAIRRRNPHDWRTNISRGARPEPLDLSGELIEMADRAADAIGAPLAGVDLLPGKDGKLYAIEVNAVPGWKGLAATLGVDVAGLVLEYLETARAQRG